MVKKQKCRRFAATECDKATRGNVTIRTMRFACLEVLPTCHTSDRRCHCHSTVMALSRTMAQFTIMLIIVCADTERCYVS